MIRKLFVLVSIASTLDAALDCIVPNELGVGCRKCGRPDPTASICAEAMIQSCNSTPESCCSRYPVKGNVDFDLCLTMYQQLYTEVHPRRCDNEICQSFVAKGGEMYNSDCVKQCTAALERSRNCVYDPESDTELLQHCRYARHTLHRGHAVPVGMCFDNWVFGGPPNSFSIHDHAPSPSYCQQLCQDTQDCARFTWTSEALPNANRADDWPGRCLLHTSVQVLDALQADMDVNRSRTPAGVDACRTGINFDQTELISWRCQLKSSCVLFSPTHVGGWKYCQQVNFCDLLQPNGMHVEQTILETSDHLVRFDVHADGSTEKPLVPEITASESDDLSDKLSVKGCDVSLCSWKACRANASQGLVLKGKPLQQATVELDFAKFPQIEVTGKVVAPAVVFEDRILIPPHVITSDQYSIASPIFEVEGERVAPPIVFVGDVDTPAIVVGNKTLPTEEIDVYVSHDAPVVIRLNDARASPLPVILVLQ